MLLVPIPWVRRVWALPFLTALAPSERYYEGKARGHKKLTDWARQMLLQVRRWLPERALVVVADSSFADMTGIMEREFTERTKFPGFFLTPVLFMVNIMYGVDFNAVKPVENVPELAPRPILFIHGRRDSYIRQDQTRLLYAQAPTPKYLWLVPEAKHNQSVIVEPRQYAARTIAFFRRHLAEEPFDQCEITAPADTEVA